MLYDLKLPDYFSKSLSYFGTPVKLNARVSCLGRESRRDISYNWDGMKRGSREFILWQLTLSGEGRLDYENESYRLKAGDAMLLHIPHRHRYYFPVSSSHWDFIYIILGGIECCRICRELEEKNGPVIHYENRCGSIETAENIFAMTDSNDPLLMSGLAYGFCLSLAADLTAPGGQGEIRPHAVEAAVRYALRHFEEPAGIDEMSEAAGLSRFYFSRLFQRYMNVSPGEFLRQLRLEKATRMLQSEQISLNEIALRSGFQSASYFCRAFRNVFGMSPGEFREMKQK